MKKALIVALAIGLLAGSIAAPATAKKKKKAKPQAVTFHLHGVDDVGELEYVNSGGFQVMDTTEASGATPKSRFVTNYIGGPNTECSGNGLYPTWRGDLVGKVTGDIKVTLQTVATPAAKVAVELYPDGAGGCNQETLGAADYIPPVAAQDVDIAPGPGTTEVVFKNVKFKTFGSLVMMLHIADQGTSPAQVRILYDSVDFGSTIELQCTPTSGKSCTP